MAHAYRLEHTREPPLRTERRRAVRAPPPTRRSWPRRCAGHWGRPEAGAATARALPEAGAATARPEAGAATARPEDATTRATQMKQHLPRSEADGSL